MIDKNSILQFNKFADLHDGKKIFFYKTDFILKAFQKIEEQNNEVILITGNSDYCIFYKNESFIIKDLNNNILSVFKESKIPKQLKYWFTVNNCTNFEFIKSLPMGIENDFECSIPGQGVGWPHAVEKVKFLSDEFINPSFELIQNNFYFNNNINTNLIHRQPIKDYLSNKNVEIDNASLNYSEFCKKVKLFKGIICPSGNGLDTHKFYESLYLRRIPILIKIDNYQIYDDLFYKFPCLILNKIDELFVESNLKLIDEKLNNFDDKLLSINYWKNYIIKFAEKML